MGILLQGFYTLPGDRGVPSPLDGGASVPFWWDHMAQQARVLRESGFTAVWLPPVLKGSSGAASVGYDPFDDYDLGTKNQKGTIPTRYGSREQLERCVAILRSNGLDVYVDMVEHHRDGDNGDFVFQYPNAYGTPNSGRFPKAEADFIPSKREFGRDFDLTSPSVIRSLIQAGDWLTKALGLQGYRLDDVKEMPPAFVASFLNAATMAGKFAVGEFFDPTLSNVQGWLTAVGHRASAFDFPLRALLKQMCSNPSSFNMSALDHAGLVGVDPFGAVTFVENHDTDGSDPIITNKALAYAYILTSEGYPSIFYKDYSRDAGCYGMKKTLDPLIRIHEHIASGATVQRWKDDGLFAFERMGDQHLLVALNKDAADPRTITVATAIGANRILHEFTGHGRDLRTGSDGSVTLEVPPNVNGGGYVCYAPPQEFPSASVQSLPVIQEYAGAIDLDIKPADPKGFVPVCRIWPQPGTPVRAALFFDVTGWNPQTKITVLLQDSGDHIIGTQDYFATTLQGAALTSNATALGWHTFLIRSSQTAASIPGPSYWMRVTYTAPVNL